MLDYNTLQVLIILAISLLIADTSVSLFMKMKLLHKCSVTCSDNSDTE